MIDLLETLALLSTQRPVFHSEADFQHALAWLIHQRHSDARIRLEYRVLGLEPVYLDLWVENEERALAIELKYPTRQLNVEHVGREKGRYRTWAPISADGSKLNTEAKATPSASGVG